MRTGLLSTALLISMVGASVAEAQTKPAEAIESRLKLMLNAPRGQSTMGMVEAYDEAARAYVVEIGRVYHKLEKGLPPNQRETLVRGQLAWQEYLKAYRVFVSYVYDADGTMHKHMAMSYLKDMLQHRLDELCAFFMRAHDEFAEDVPEGDAWCSEKHGDLGLDDLLAPASQAAKAPEPTKRLRP